MTYSLDEIKESLGKHYVKKVLAKASGISYWELYRALKGEQNDVKLVKRTIKAVDRAMAEQKELEALNSSFNPSNKAA